MRKFLESDTVKQTQTTSIAVKRSAIALAIVLASQLAVDGAQAGAGFGSGLSVTNAPTAPATYYANSPAGPVPVLVNGAPTIRGDGSGLPIAGTTGVPLRKFVDKLPGFGAANANDLGQYIPVAVPSKWVDGNGLTTADDYYEIAAVEFTEKLHADLPKATHLRGYVQLMKPGQATTLAAAQAISPTAVQLTYADGLTPVQQVVYVPSSLIDVTGQIVTLPSAAGLTATATVTGGGFPAGTTIVSVTQAVAATATTPAVPASFTTSAAAVAVAGAAAGTTGPNALQAALTITGGPVFAYDKPHHLGPVINAAMGTAVRVKFINYLPIYANNNPATAPNFFLPVDTTLPGAGLGPDGTTYYTQNRAGMHVFGAQAPWISSGSPHQWVAPAGETAAYAAGIGKGASTQNVPDMADPGPGAATYYFPNAESARLTFFRDETSGIARLNTYAGLAGVYKITDTTEQALVAAGTLPAAELPLIFEDKTFVPANIAQQDAAWINPNWGVTGDLWFPHVYEPNQDPNQASGVNPVGRWDYGPLFWPIFQVSPDKATLPAVSFTPETYLDTVLVNGTAYPTVTVEPKAYRVRLANASNDRYLNLGFYVADGSVAAQVLDVNGNPTVTAAGVLQTVVNTEVKMIPAAAIDAAGDPPGWDVTTGQQQPLPQFGTTFPWHINYAMSGPTRAWPVDARVGGVPDPATSGPDFIQFGSDGGFLPGAVDIPSQPITYEQNRRSITVTNIYGYGMLIGPGERADTVVDFTPFAGKTLILYNDAPTPAPFLDQRDDYFTGDPDQTALGGWYSTLPGYGPNTRTVMQVVVGSAITSGGPLNATALAAALPAAYKATQPVPLVTQAVYNAAFGTTNPDTFARVATGSAAQPNLTFSTTGALQITGFQLVTSGGAGTGSGSGYATPPTVTITGGGGTGATAYAYVGTSTTGSIVNNLAPLTGSTVTVADTTILLAGEPVSGGGFPAGTTITAINSATTFTTSQASAAPGSASLSFCLAGQVCAVALGSPGSNYTSAPTVTFASDNSVASVSVVSGGSGYSPTDIVTFSGGGGTTTATGTLTIASSSSISPKLVALNGGAGYTVAPTVQFSGGGATTAAVASPTLASSTLITALNGTLGSSAVTVVPGSGYSAPVTASVSAPNVAGTQATATPVVGFALAAPVIVAGTGIVPGAGITGYAGPTAWQITTPQVSGNAISTASISFPAPSTGIVANTAQGTVTVDLNSANLTYGQVIGITITNPGAGYITAPVATISDLGGASASVTVPLAAATGQLLGVNIVNPGTGYTAPASITINSATGTGASGTASVSALATVGGVLVPSGVPSTTPVGVVTGLVFSNAGAGYTSVPAVQFNNNGTATTAASATVQLSNAVGAITGVTLTNHGAGYTAVPAGTITAANGTASAGTGASLVPVIASSGVGAQAIALTTSSFSYPTLTKAEQELFDDYGRYNSTGGVELPYTTASVQTTIPLNYMDAPTEVIGDGEVQIWKIVDNGFWTNSIHFNMANVQLVNRVGWDGTVKAPASNEAGWKDTLRLNPLEDMIVAVQGKRSQAGFGQPRSTRLQDPSSPAGTASHPAAPTPGVAGTRYVQGLGFTADPGVVQQSGLFATGSGPSGQPIVNQAANATTVAVNTPLLTTAANTGILPASPTGNYDNEFLWGSAIMGHAQDDLQRPVVFNPDVQIPNTPGGFADLQGNGVLSWVDPTPAAAATTAGNPQNEIGFTVLQAPVTNGAVSGAFAPFANIPANTVVFSEPAPLVSPTPPGGQFYAYEVLAYNAAGASLPSSPVIEAPPVAPTGLVLTPGFITGATSTADVNMGLAWNDNATNETNYILTRKGGVATQAALATAVAGSPVTLPSSPGTGIDTATDAGPLTEQQWYEYDLIARNSFGDSTPVLVGQIQAPISVPLAPTGVLATMTPVACPVAVPVRCAPDDVVLTWTDNAFNETAYQITRSGGPTGAPNVTVPLPANSTTWTDHAVQEGYPYVYTISALNTSLAGATQAGSTTYTLTTVLNPINLPTQPTAVVVAPSTALDARSMYVDTATVTFNDNAYTETGYNIYRNVGTGYNPATAVLAGSVLPGAANNPWGTKTSSWAASPQLTFLDTGLVDGATYTWTVQAINGTGTSTSAPVTRTMPGILIAPPSNLVATPNRAATTIGLCWTDNSTNETDFLVEESVSTVGGTNGTFGAWATPAGSPVARTAAQTTSTGTQVCFNRGGVPTTAGYVYNFRVSARNLANHSDSHPYATAMTSLAAPAAPAAPVLAAPVVTATGTGGQRVTLTWNKLTPVAGTTLSYQVFANGVQIATVAQARAAATTVTVRLNVPLLTTTQTISYTVKAVATAIPVVPIANQTVFGSTAGPASNAVSAAIPAAPANAMLPPTGITSTVNATTGAVTLAWTAATGAPAGSTVSYRVSINGGAGTTLVSGGTLNVARGASYQVQVATAFRTAAGATTIGAYSAPVTVNTLPAQSTGLAALLVTPSATGGTFSVNWANVSTNITGWTIQRGVTGAAGVITWTTITPTINAAGTTYGFTDTVTALGTYSYRVLATSAAGNTAYVTTAAVTTPLPAPTGITSAVNAATGTVTLSWTAVTPPAGGTVSYRVSVNGGAALTLASGGTLNVAAGASYSVAVATAVTVGGGGGGGGGATTIGGYSTPITVNTHPAQSTGLVATASSTVTHTATVAWTNTSTNITGWTVQRGLVAANGTVTWTTIAPTITAAGTAYSFTDVAPAAGNYQYRVLATSTAGSTAYVTSARVAL